MNKPAALNDHGWMQQALRLASLGLNSTTPNPRVGCVLVKDGRQIGAGWHERAGEPHAEVHALRQAGDAVQGATAYVTLEPCSHFGRTPPCADALIAAGVARVVIAMLDPNPQVAGQGMARLQAAGIACSAGVLQDEALELNKGFVSRMLRGRPWLTLKIAASLDGRTALASGESQWITGPQARADVQRWRAASCAILTGSGTILADDPQLTVRSGQPVRQPLRVALDSHLYCPPTAKVLQAAGGALLFAAKPTASATAALEAAGAEVMLLPGSDGRVDLAMVLQELGRRGCNDLLVEAGSRLNGALLQQGWVDDLLLYQAPILLGDAARGLADFTLQQLADKLAPQVLDRRLLGADLRTHLRFTPLRELLRS